MTRILTGDSAAEEELVTCHYRVVRGVLRQLMGGRADAEDLLQETFHLALVKLRGGQLQQPARLRAFLISLARNLAINQFRIEARRRTEADSEAAESRPCSTPDPFGQLISIEQAGFVRRLLADLHNPRDREILFRFYIAEDDKSTICHDLELSSLQFNRVLHRARRRCKRLCQERAA